VPAEGPSDRLGGGTVRGFSGATSGPIACLAGLTSLAARRAFRTAGTAMTSGRSPASSTSLCPFDALAALTLCLASTCSALAGISTSATARSVPASSIAVPAPACASWGAPSVRFDEGSHPAVVASWPELHSSGSIAAMLVPRSSSRSQPLPPDGTHQAYWGTCLVPRCPHRQPRLAQAAGSLSRYRARPSQSQLRFHLRLAGAASS